MLDFIKSKDYRKYIKDNNIVINNWDIATIIINNESVLYQDKEKKLLEIAEKTDNKELNQQVINYIDVCKSIFMNIKRADCNAYYELRTKENKAYDVEGIFLDFEKAYATGVKENVPFYIEKCKFRDIAKSYIEEYIGTAYFNPDGELIRCNGDSSPVKKPDIRKSLEYRYVDLPYMFRYGDVVRIVGTDTIGIISAFRNDEEELEYRKKAKNWDYSDFQIYVDVIFKGDKFCTDFHHEHVAPIELEYFAFDENDKRKGYMDYLVQHRKMTSL